MAATNCSSDIRSCRRPCALARVQSSRSVNGAPCARHVDRARCALPWASRTTSAIGCGQRGVVALPDSGPLLICGRSVQRRYQLVDFGSHDGDDVGTLGVDGGERVRRASWDGHVIALLKKPSFGTDEDLETTSKDDESLVGKVMSMRWRLVSRVVGQVPSPHHKVAHGMNVSARPAEGRQDASSSAAVRREVCDLLRAGARGSAG